MSKISGPLLDRIDIHLEIPAVKYQELMDLSPQETSAQIKLRVQKTRHIQIERFKNEGVFSNAAMNKQMIKKYCQLNTRAQELLKAAMTELEFSARSFDKILKISRTIADMGGSLDILAEHIAEAVQYNNKNL